MNKIAPYAQYALLLAVMFLCGGFIAQAQNEPVIPDSFGSIFTSIGALSVFVIAVVSYLKGHIWTTMQGWQTLLVSFIVSEGVSLIGFYMKLLVVTDIVSALSFGFGAFMLASGMVKFANTYKSSGGTSNS